MEALSRSLFTLLITRLVAPTETCLLICRSSSAGNRDQEVAPTEARRLRDPAGTAEQDAPPTDRAETDIGCVAFLSAWRDASAGSRDSEIAPTERTS